MLFIRKGALSNGNGVGKKKCGKSQLQAWCLVSSLSPFECGRVEEESDGLPFISPCQPQGYNSKQISFSFHSLLICLYFPFPQRFPSVLRARLHGFF